MCAGMSVCEHGRAYVCVYRYVCVRSCVRARERMYMHTSPLSRVRSCMRILDSVLRLLVTKTIKFHSTPWGQNHLEGHSVPRQVGAAGERSLNASIIKAKPQGAPAMRSLAFEDLFLRQLIKTTHLTADDGDSGAEAGSVYKKSHPPSFLVPIPPFRP